MAETLDQFIVRRRNELDVEEARLQAAVDAVRAEREQINRVAVMIGPPGTQAIEGGTFTTQERAPKRLSEATLKMMVLNVLTAVPDGQTALEILERINRTVDPPYPRTSLSPQLSRLKAEGKIHRNGRTWLLGNGPDIGDASDGDLSENDLGQAERDAST